MIAPINALPTGARQALKEWLNEMLKQGLLSGAAWGAWSLQQVIYAGGMRKGSRTS